MKLTVLFCCPVWLNQDHAVDFVHDIQNTKEDEHFPNISGQARRRGVLHGVI